MWGTLIEVRQGQQAVGRVAVTDGMSAEAVKILEDAGHEVVLHHYTPAVSYTHLTLPTILLV